MLVAAIAAVHGEGVVKYTDGTITNGSWKDGNLHDGVVNKNRTPSENTAQGRVVALSASNGTAQGGSKNNGGGIRQQAPPTQHAFTTIQLLTLKKQISEYKQLRRTLVDLDINFIREGAARAMAQARAAMAQARAARAHMLSEKARARLFTEAKKVIASKKKSQSGGATLSAAPAAAAPLLGSKRKRDTEDCVTTETVSPIDALRRRMNPENTVDLTT